MTIRSQHQRTRVGARTNDRTHKRTPCTHTRIRTRTHTTTHHLTEVACRVEPLALQLCSYDAMACVENAIDGETTEAEMRRQRGGNGLCMEGIDGQTIWDVRANAWWAAGVSAASGLSSMEVPRAHRSACGIHNVWSTRDGRSGSLRCGMGPP